MIRRQNIKYIVEKFRQAYPDTSVEALRDRLMRYSVDEICYVADAIARFGVETLRMVLCNK